MAEVGEVEATLASLVARLESLPAGQRALLPGRRMLEARCPDLGLVHHARWQDGRLGPVQQGPAPRRADIRIEVSSDDLLAMSRGELDATRAWSEGRVRLKASMTDMLRLRAAIG